MMGNGERDSTGFVKFPRTPHIFWIGRSLPREDKLLGPDEACALLQRPVAVEEKVDGACLGLSVAPTGEVRVQTRGRYLSRGELGQFRPLWSWLAHREDTLRRALGIGLVLFGEWCYARHTVAYDGLPDWFLTFDVYDREAHRFWSRDRRNELAARVRLATVPLLAIGTFDRSRLEPLLGSSRVGSDPMEGLYLRWDEGPWLTARAKLVRAGWIQADDLHWSRRLLETNRLLGPLAPAVDAPSA